MLTIKTHLMTVTRQNTDVMSVAPSMDVIHFRFVDNVELGIPFKITPQITVMLGMIQTAPVTANITVDFTNPNQLISFA